MIRIIEKLNNLKESKGDVNDKIILSVTDPEKEIYKLLEYIKKLADRGHSFNVIVDPDSENETKFGIDGDGATHIINMEYEKVETKVEESVKNIDSFKKENELTDEMINTLKEFYNSEANTFFKDLDFVNWLYAIKDYEGGTIYSEILENHIDI